MIRITQEVDFDDVVYQAQSQGLCVTIDELMGNEELGQDENERYGWEVMIGDVSKSHHGGAVPALLDAIDYAESCKLPLHLSKHFIQDLGGGWYGMLTREQWKAANLDEVTDEEWDEMNK